MFTTSGLLASAGLMMQLGVRLEMAIARPGATPFLQGLLVGLLAGSLGFGATCGELALSGATGAIALLCLGIEGLVCIAMAIPLWFLIAAAGATGRSPCPRSERVSRA